MRKVIWSVVALIVAVIIVTLAGCGESRDLVYDLEGNWQRAKMTCESKGDRYLRFVIHPKKPRKTQLEARCIDMSKPGIYAVFTKSVTK